MGFREDAPGFFAALTETFRCADLAHLLNEERQSALLSLADFLMEENAKYNLTAITDRDGILLRHFADSATLARHLAPGARLLDVGCGAGFPSLVLAILRPDLSVTALDSTEKRVRYVNSAAAHLSLSNIRAITLRAEDGAKSGSAHGMRERFDVVTARAVARLPILAELCLPYVRCGGFFLAMKGKGAEEEVAESLFAIRTLGGELVPTEDEVLTGSSGETMTRRTVAVRKVSPTPAAYPRHFSQISKKPLVK